MKTSITARKIWLVMFSLIFLHSLFPPGLYQDTNTSAGRSLIVWPLFYKADHMTWNDSMDGTPRQTAFHERKQKSQGAPGVTAWNPAAFDFGSYIAEVILLLSLGAMMTIYRNLRGVRKESEQAGTSVRDSAPV